jgi:hypothetical protein
MHWSQNLKGTGSILVGFLVVCGTGCESTPDVVDISQLMQCDGVAGMPFSGKVTGENTEEKWRVEGQYVNGKEAGQWSYVYLDGEKKTAGEFKDGLRVGSWVEFHPNGQKKAEGSYSGVTLERSANAWPPDTAPQSSKVGSWTYWDQEGTIIWQGEHPSNGDVIAKFSGCVSTDAHGTILEFAGVDGKYWSFESSRQLPERKLCWGASPMLIDQILQLSLITGTEKQCTKPLWEDGLGVVGCLEYVEKPAAVVSKWKSYGG